MSIKILDAVRYYNANPDAKSKPDCVIRALSMAYDMDYKDVKKELREIMKGMNLDVWNIRLVFEVFIKDHGVKDTVKIKEDITVGEFMESHPTGTYIIRCQDRPITRGSKSGHLVAMVDGDIYDSWDCTRYYLDYYYLVDGDTSVISAIDTNKLYELIKEEIEEYGNKLIKKAGISEYKFEETSKYLKEQSIIVYYNFKVTEYLPRTVDNPRSFKFVYNFNPRYSNDKTLQIIENVTKNYLNKYIGRFKHDWKEGLEADALTGDYPDLYRNRDWDAELIHKLPQWARNSVISMQYNPEGKRYGTYMYDVEIKALRGDPRATDADDTVVFYADDINDLRDQLDTYKKTFHRFGYDY